MGESTKNLFRPLIVGVVTSGNCRDPLAWDALPSCDLIEFRADAMEAGEIPGRLSEFRQTCKLRLGALKETMVTLRLERDGGAWPNEKARAREPVWRELLSSEDGRACEWLDVEVEEIHRLSSDILPMVAASGTKLLLSHHDFQSCPNPGRLESLLRTMLAAPADGVKFAVTCGSDPEILALLEFGKSLAEAVAPEAAGARKVLRNSVFSMGAPGSATRVLSPLLGCPLTYGYLTGGPVAPGQLSVRQLARFYEGVAHTGNGNLEQSLEWARGRLEETGFVA